MYISHLKREQPISNTSTRIKPLLQKIFSLETTIIGEAQEYIGACMSMYESPIFIYFHVDKGMVSLHL